MLRTYDSSCSVADRRPYRNVEDHNYMQEQMNVTVQWLAFLLGICVVLGSVVGPQTGCYSSDVLWFSSDPSGNSRIVF